MGSAVRGNAAARYDALPEIGEYKGNVSHTTFWDGAVWPIPEIALAALVDMGLSDASIARYFSVASANVESLRLRYGIRAAP